MGDDVHLSSSGSSVCLIFYIEEKILFLLAFHFKGLSASIFTAIGDLRSSILWIVMNRQLLRCCKCLWTTVFFQSSGSSSLLPPSLNTITWHLRYSVPRLASHRFGSYYGVVNVRRRWWSPLKWLSLISCL